MKKTKAALAEIGLFAPLVIAQRMSRMMLPDVLRNAADSAEDSRMVAEKTQAASDGFFAAHAEMTSQMMRAWTGMAFGVMPNALKAADAITSAALKPARVKVRSNARRLAKRSVK